MKPTKQQIMTIAAVLYSGSSAVLFGDVTGTVRGSFRVTDNRTAPSAAAIRPASPGTLAPLQRMVVAITARSQSQAINPTTFAVTDTTGAFEGNWRDRTSNGFPVELRIEALMTMTNGAGGGTSHPTTQFTIVRFPSTTATQTFRRDATNANLNVGAITLTANDETASYLTAHEVWRAIVRFSDRLEDRMPGLKIKTRVPSFNFSFGVAPFHDEVLISENTPRTSPITLAHEIGHTITWSALDVNSAPINPATDYGFDFHWERDTRESSKAAFLEGMADFWSIIWAFGSDTNVTLARGSKTFAHEGARVTNADGDVTLRCGTVSNAHEFPFCNTAALLDLADNDPTGGDGVDLALSTVVNILNAFPNGCIFNGCRDELGFDALNANDFLRNAPANLQGGIASVWALNGLGGGF